MNLYVRQDYSRAFEMTLQNRADICVLYHLNITGPMSYTVSEIFRVKLMMLSKKFTQNLENFNTQR